MKSLALPLRAGDEPEIVDAVDDEASDANQVAALVKIWRAQKQRILNALAEIEEAESELARTFERGRFCVFSYTRQHHCSSMDQKAAQGMFREFELEIWKSLCETMELRRFMSVKAMAELDARLAGNGIPLGEISEQAVKAFFKSKIDCANGMAEEAVREVFNFLRPQGSAKKTNTEFEIGRRVILEGYIDASFSGPSVRYGRRDQLAALDRVFSMLEGKGSIGKTADGLLVDAIKSCTWEKAKGETDYFRFRFFRNGNLHLEFKRLDLVKELNEIAGGRALKGEKAAPGPRMPRVDLWDAPEKADDNGQFWTPAELAEEKARMLELEEFVGSKEPVSILEPSAGQGSLVKATIARCRALGVLFSIHAVEDDWEVAKELHAIESQVEETEDGSSMHVRMTDFSRWAQHHTGAFDRVIMNPPFHSRADVHHVALAWGCLRSGGVLLATMSKGSWSSEREHKCLELRGMLEATSSFLEVNDLAPETFKESGTLVRTVLIKAVKL